ncbi:hypothetical protein OAK75_02050 [Bacteriovoracales bacterium]|nr:hypothetical protein [Bacteriovoracales bacterium]
MAIHKASKDPVLIKKIALQIWSLRTEIEEVIRYRVSEANKREIEKPPLDDLIEEYSGKVAPQEIEAIFESTSEEAEGEEAEGEEAEEEESEGNTVTQRNPLIPKDKITNGKTLLSEINMEYLFLFSANNFIEGKNVVVKFLVPKAFSLNAEVIHCRKHTMSSRVISGQKLPHRACFKFTFLKPGERSLLRQFLFSVKPEKVITEDKDESEEESGDDDFGELDDLDM